MKKSGHLLGCDRPIEPKTKTTRSKRSQDNTRPQLNIMLVSSKYIPIKLPQSMTPPQFLACSCPVGRQLDQSPAPEALASGNMFENGEVILREKAMQRVLDQIPPGWMEAARSWRMMWPPCCRRLSCNKKAC